MRAAKTNPVAIAQPVRGKNTKPNAITLEALTKTKLTYKLFVTVAPLGKKNML
jgi:hypothetical protein